MLTRAFASQLTGSVMEITTVKTGPMNRTVAPLPRQLVHTVTVGAMLQYFKVQSMKAAEVIHLGSLDLFEFCELVSTS